MALLAICGLWSIYGITGDLWTMAYLWHYWQIVDYGVSMALLAIICGLWSIYGISGSTPEPVIMQAKEASRKPRRLWL